MRSSSSGFRFGDVTSRSSPFKGFEFRGSSPILLYLLVLVSSCLLFECTCGFPSPLLGCLVRVNTFCIKQLSLLTFVLLLKLPLLPPSHVQDLLIHPVSRLTSFVKRVLAERVHCLPRLVLLHQVQPPFGSWSCDLRQFVLWRLVPVPPDWYPCFVPFLPASCQQCQFVLHHP